MASSDGDGHITLDKFSGDNFNLYKLKLEMVMSTKDLWEIVEGSELLRPFTASDEVNKTYERRCKKAFAIIATSLMDKELAHIKECNDICIDNAYGKFNYLDTYILWHKYTFIFYIFNSILWQWIFFSLQFLISIKLEFS